MISFLGVSLLLLQGSSAFTSLPFSRKPAASTSTAVFGIQIDDIEDVGYYTSVQKPLGVIFGENPEPYLGVRVDDIELGSQGGLGGLRVGDQLLAVNGDVVIGDSFDSCMGILQSSPAKMKLLLYRGSVRDLYTILNNRNIEDDDDDDGSEVVIMDENYESPVRIEVKEDQGIDLMKVFSKLTEKKASPEPAAPE